MSKARFAFGLLLCVGMLPVVSQAQNETVLSRQSDESARTREEREQSRNVLLDAAREIGNSDPAKAAGFLNRAARLQFRLNSSQDALASYQSALTLLKRFPDSPVLVESLNGIVYVFVQLGKCDQAQTYINQAISVSDRQHSVSGRAEALLNRSDCQSLSDLNEASQTIAESLRLFTSAGDKKGIARASMLQGDFQIMQSDLTEATKNNETALDIWRELGIQDEEASALINLGFIQYRRGAWQECMTFLTQAQAMIDEKSEPSRMAQIYAGIAESFMESGIPEAGLKNAVAALNSYQLAEDPQGIAAATWDIGKAHYLQGNYDDAIKWFEDARNEAQLIKVTRIVALCNDFLGRTYLARGEPDRALEYLKSALASYIQLKNRREEARTRVLIGRIYDRQGKTSEARRLLLEGTAALERMSDHVNEAVAFFALGQLELRSNNLDRAEEYLRRSIEMTEAIRGATTSGDLTTAMSATVSDRYDSYVDCLMRRHAQQPERGFATRAFETNELARARTLATLLRSKQTGLASLDPELAAREKSLLQSLRVKENARITLLQKSYDKNALTAVETELNELETQYQQIQNVIRERYPAYQEMMQPGVVTLSEIQKKVLSDDQSLLLEYALGDERSYLWLVSGDKLVSYVLPGRNEIEDAARQLYSSLTAFQPKPDETFEQRQERTRQADEMLPNEIAQLSKLVLTPVAEQLGKKRLIIVADGALQYIPFQVLTLPTPVAKNDSSVAAEPSVPLIVDHEIINEPSASTLALLLGDSVDIKRSVGTVAIFADPVFEADDARVTNRTAVAETKRASETDEVARVFRDVGQSIDNRRIPRLLASRQEAEAIMAVVPWRTAFKALDFEASRATLSAPSFGQYRILHFATHTMIDNEHPELSGIVLSLLDPQGRPLNGFLRMSDIYDLKLSSNLVVLSACSTALGKEVKGEGLISLTRGFLYAGASGVTASLWKVDDEATAELMRHFYGGIFKRGLTPAAALREAQLAMWKQKRWRAPYYWAAFVIQGQYNQTEAPYSRWSLPSAEKVAFIGIVAVLLLTSLILVIRRKKA
ncbi:MAG TPA: CHAT domain-containing tetratricopeptide repeat protein [Pyrinomonadaceae bacterium]|nr:CHAT domain-containing tetratricopeptide repeat protein [Pyrinomonadaceae bacterium]